MFYCSLSAATIFRHNDLPCITAVYAAAQQEPTSPQRQQHELTSPLHARLHRPSAQMDQETTKQHVGVYQHQQLLEYQQIQQSNKFKQSYQPFYQEKTPMTITAFHQQLVEKTQRQKQQQQHQLQQQQSRFLQQHEQQELVTKLLHQQQQCGVRQSTDAVTLHQERMSRDMETIFRNNQPTTQVATFSSLPALNVSSPSNQTVNQATSTVTDSAPSSPDSIAAWKQATANLRWKYTQMKEPSVERRIFQRSRDRRFSRTIQQIQQNDISTQQRRNEINDSCLPKNNQHSHCSTNKVNSQLFIGTTSGDATISENQWPVQQPMNCQLAKSPPPGSKDDIEKSPNEVIQKVSKLLEISDNKKTRLCRNQQKMFIDLTEDDNDSTSQVDAQPLFTLSDEAKPCLPTEEKANDSCSLEATEQLVESKSRTDVREMTRNLQSDIELAKAQEKGNKAYNLTILTECDVNKNAQQSPIVDEAISNEKSVEEPPPNQNPDEVKSTFNAESPPKRRRLAKKSVVSGSQPRHNRSSSTETHSHSSHHKLQKSESCPGKVENCRRISNEHKSCRKTTLLQHLPEKSKEHKKRRVAFAEYLNWTKDFTTDSNNNETIEEPSPNSTDEPQKKTRDEATLKPTKEQKSTASQKTREATEVATSECEDGACTDVLGKLCQKITNTHGDKKTLESNTVFLNCHRNDRNEGSSSIDIYKGLSSFYDVTYSWVYPRKH